MLKKLTLQNFRSHLETTVEFADSITLIHGPNGVGKTNIIEALYVLSQGKSFLTSRLIDTLNHDQNEFMIIRGETTDHVLEFIIDNRVTTRKLARLDGGKIAIKNIISKIPVILFEPRILQLVTEEPAERRKYLDRVLCQLSPAYRDALRQYTRVLTQRNSLLKRIREQQVSVTELDSWDSLLSEHARTIIQKRTEFFQELEVKKKDAIDQLTDESVDISYHYEPSHKEPDLFLSGLSERRNEDISAGLTLRGPHRDDFVIQFNEREAKSFASRGQQRICVLALLLVEYALITELLPQDPLLLCDDVLSELDQAHKERLFAAFSDIQTIITSAHKDSLPYAKEIFLP